MKKKTLIIALAVLAAVAVAAVVLILNRGGEKKPTGQVVNVYNWYDYMDEEVFDLFEEETGIHVNKMYFTTNEDMMVQVRVSPGAYDLVFPSDYCVERMISENMLAEINFDNVPNFSNVSKDLVNPDYDPENKYSVPFMWGTVGILYNTTMVDEPVDSWGILWDEKYADNIIMLDSIRDTMGVALKYLGYSMNTREVSELKAATDKLIEQKPLVKAYYVDETKDKMVAGEAALAVVYSGDALYAIEKNEDLAYVVPKEGSNVWIDPMVIPATAKNKENAEKLIDFLCRPDIAKKNCEYIWYSSPNAAAIELMGEDYTENATINPSEEVIANCEFFHDIPDNFLTIYNSFWSQVKNAR
ncbi:MAG: spermidine/putrescine ABC transporter substrate-binding protein [Clostridia bacterium]|nr:spermidine/putrescine ABC transporter substrate-binding protein [Clostridia bacterium]